MSKAPVKYKHKITGMIAAEYTDEFYLVRSPRTFLKKEDVEENGQWEKIPPLIRKNRDESKG